MSFVKKVKPHEFNIWPGKKHLLGHIDIELTERCNNNCIHCYINQPELDSNTYNREISHDFIKRILTESAKLGFLTVRFTGGEPLLRQDFEELYLFTRRLGMQVILFTNARLITENIAELLAKYPPGHDVEISVYGMTPESYDRVVQHVGAFAEFRLGIDMLLKHKVPFIVKGIKLRFLKDEQEVFEAWTNTIPSMHSTPTYSFNYDLRARRDDPLKNASIKKLRLTPEESVDILTRDPLFLNGMGQFFSRFLCPSDDKLFNCGAGHGVSVDAYGYAQLCLLLRSPETVVNLHEVSLKRALTELFPAILETKATNKDYLRRCARCFLKGLCQQCPAKSWLENGTLDTPVEYLCEVAHAQARFFGLIEKNENAWEVDDWTERIERFVINNTPTL